jgi:hypothetical protein
MKKTILALSLLISFSAYADTSISCVLTTSDTQTCSQTIVDSLGGIETTTTTGQITLSNIDETVNQTVQVGNGYTVTSLNSTVSSSIYSDEVIAKIKEDMTNLSKLTQMDLYKYLATTNYTAEELSFATGYSVADIKKVIDDSIIAISTYNNIILNVALSNGKNLADTYAQSASYSSAFMSNIASTYNNAYNQDIATGAVYNSKAMATASQELLKSFATQQALNAVNNGSVNSTAVFSPSVIETIQAQVLALKNSEGGQAALNVYLATTNFTVEQLSSATGYNIADLQNAINTAKQSIIMKV